MPDHFRPDDSEFATMLLAPADRRLDYFVEKVADWGEAWGLRDPEGNWCSMHGPGQPRCVALWPAEAFARAASLGSWARCRAEPLDLHDLVDRFMLGWEARGLFVAVFPLPSGRAIPLAVSELRGALVEEAERTGDRFGLGQGSSDTAIPVARRR